MIEGRKGGFADWVTEDDHWIDSDAGFRGSPAHNKAIQEALKDIDGGLYQRLK